MAPRLAVTAASVLLALAASTTTSVHAAELVAQTAHHMVMTDLLGHRICGRTKGADGTWPEGNSAGCVTAESLPRSPESPGDGSQRVVQGQLAVGSFSGSKVAVVALVAETHPMLPAAHFLEALTVGVAGTLVHRPQCRRFLGRAVPRMAHRGGRLALSGTPGADPNQMLLASMTADGVGVDVFHYCSSEQTPVATHTFDNLVLDIHFAGGGAGETQVMWVLTKYTLSQIATPTGANSAAGHINFPLPEVVTRPQDGGRTIPHTMALEPGTGESNATSIVIGLFAGENRDAPVAVRCKIAAAALTACRPVEDEDELLAGAFAGRTAPFAATVAAATSTRPILGAGGTVGAASSSAPRFAVAVGVATGAGFGVRYFGGSAAWQRGNGATTGGSGGGRPVVLAGASASVRPATAAVSAGIKSSAADALRFETTTGDPRLAPLGLAAAAHEVVGVVLQESGAVAVEHHGDSIDGGWTPFSSFGSCSVQCKTGLKCRSRHCTAPASEYGGAPCGGLAEECAMCQVFTYAWVIGAPSQNCLDATTGGPVCGAGVRNREVVCKRCNVEVDDSFCSALESKPSVTVPCHAQYYVRAYGDCIKTSCGHGIRHEGTCRSCNNSNVSLDNCDGSPPLAKPTIPCDGERPTMMPFGWLMNNWDNSDATCLAHRGCSLTRTRHSRCAMCDGRVISADFGGDDSCIESDKCRYIYSHNAESLSPITDGQYGKCSSVMFQRDFWRVGTWSGASITLDKKPLTYQRCPCGMYGSGLAYPFQQAIHPTWWHRERCTGHAYSCTRKHHNLIFLKKLDRSKHSKYEGLPYNHLRRAPGSPTGPHDKDYLDMYDTYGGSFVYWYVDETTSDETEACHKLEPISRGTAKCIEGGAYKAPIIQENVYVGRAYNWNYNLCNAYPNQNYFHDDAPSVYDYKAFSLVYSHLRYYGGSQGCYP